MDKIVMDKISDELREFADAEVLSAIQISDLKHMAKRIDAEMVELPKDADGVPILTTACRGIKAGFRPSELTHTRPDSWKRIADELEELSVDSMVGDIDLLSSCALDLADRIRKLAAKEDRQ